MRLAPPTDVTEEPACSVESALVDDQYISKPEFSTAIRGSVSNLNTGSKGVDFLVNDPSTTVSIILPLKPNVRITKLAKLQILRPSNVNQFRLALLNKQRKSLGQYRILSSKTNDSSVSPTITEFPLKDNLYPKIRFVQIDILETDDDRSPKRVSLLFEACFEKIETTPESKYLSSSLLVIFPPYRSLQEYRCHGRSIYHSNSC